MVERDVRYFGLLVFTAVVLALIPLLYPLHPNSDARKACYHAAASQMRVAGGTFVDARIGEIKAELALCLSKIN